MNRIIHQALNPKMPKLLHGGDYNPDQWPCSIWAEDDRLMKAAHWNSVTLGVFSWAAIEPHEGEFDFDWLDRIFSIQMKSGRMVGLATPSAAPPAWLSQAYPETLRVGPDGVRHKHGNRVNYCFSSPEYREMVHHIDRELAYHFGNHPNLAFWHISNEFGGECYCDLCVAEFRKWLKERYSSLEALNAAYWTTFWGHTYDDWEEIEAPGQPHGETAIIGLTVDWKRFQSDRIIDFYLAEKAILNETAPNVPCTTNLMGIYPGLNCWKIAEHLDFATWDSYPWFGSKPEELNSWVFTSMCHDLCRSLKLKPFLLMECTPSSSNWYPTMNLKRPRAHKLEGLQAVAHGSEGVQYFQWRQGRGGSEQFHGAVVAHNQHEDARVFQEVAELGQTLEELADVAGSDVDAEVALIFDWENGWAIDSVAAPRTKKRDYIQTLVEHYKSFWSAGISVDLSNPEADLSNYKLVVAPMLFMMSDCVQRNLASYVEQGGTLVLTYWSGVVNESTLAYVGGFPTPLRDALGLWVEEIDALYEGQENGIRTANTDLLDNGATYKAADLCERIHPTTAEVLARYTSDFYADEPAATRNRYGKGTAYYVASRNEAAFCRDFLHAVASKCGIQPVLKGSWSEGITVQCRRGRDRDFLFVLNCSNKEGSIDLLESLEDAASGAPCGERMILPGFGVRVLVRHLDPVGNIVAAPQDVAGLPLT